MGLTAPSALPTEGQFFISARHYCLARVVQDGKAIKYHLLGDGALHDDVEWLMESRPFLVGYPWGHEIRSEGLFAPVVDYYHAIFSDGYEVSKAAISAATATLLSCDESHLRIKVENPEKASDLIDFFQGHFHVWMATQAQYRRQN